MSRLAKKPIQIPEKTTVVVADNLITVRGPLGELSKTFKSAISVLVEEDSLTLTTKTPSLEARALSGTYASHLRNMLRGVHKPYEKKLLIEGIGFKADVKGTDVILSLGFSHPVKVAIPVGITVKTEKGAMIVSGIDKELVGSFAAKLRDLKKPEPYKGKGIRYEGEVIHRKQGKKAVASA